MQTLLLIALGALVAVWIIILRVRNYGFAGQRCEDYDGTNPRFDLFEHLNGPMICEGVIFGPTGRVVSRFVADFEITWDGRKGLMTERFLYDSGATQERAWRIDVADDGSIRAQADDVEGVARGQRAGFGVRMDYRLRLPKDAGGHLLSATDWMYLLNNGTIVNRSQFRKFGIKVAELVATIRPQQTEGSS